MVGYLGRSLVRSSVGDEAELAALLGPILREALGQFGQREPVGFLAVDQGFDDVGGQGRQLENAGHIRAIDVEGTGKLADGLDLAGFEDVGPGKGPCQRLEDGGLHRFRRLGLPRYAEVDSELIFRLADRFAPEGPIDQEGLKKALALCRGQMSAVLASKLDPGTITVLKGNKPLCLRIHRQHRVVLYASETAFIDFAVDNEKGWRELEVPPMTMLTIRHEDVRAIENSEFRFIPQERKGTLPEGVNA